MRGMIVIALIAALAVLAGGILATQISGSPASLGPPSNTADAVSTPSGEGVATPEPSSDETSSPDSATPNTSTGQQPTGSGQPAPTIAGTSEVGAQPVGNVLDVQPPVRGAPINGVQAVQDYYSERHRFENIVVSWYPGAFPAERAELVANQTRAAIAEVNERLGTNDHGEIEVLLADRMYLEEDCHGCQGYAFSDFRQVFILQDGSMADDEFEALLTHEVGHVIAGSNIALPHVATLFMAEGLATWLMTPALIDHEYIEPRQIAAWAWKENRIPPIWELRKAKFEGRTGARVEYDPAGSFTQFFVETYGIANYKELYAAELPDNIIDKTWEQLEQEWHSWLAAWADNTVNGVDAQAWWSASDLVTQGFERLYADETTVTQQQYAQLATARVALNKGDIETAIVLMQTSNLLAGTAN